ncbi:phage portal protein [Anaerohalosphaeraceae bacterium U12dextr]|jgi:lambda family phage portal protein
MFGFGKKKSQATTISDTKPQRFGIRARFDAAQNSTDNAKHWAMADPFSPDLAASPQVRATLRNRARYEVANNSYAKGMVLTLANDCVGTGPRLQMLLPDDAANKVIEQMFKDWADEISLAAKLRTARMARVVDGETFCIKTYNPMLRSPIKLDLKLVEAEQVTTPWEKQSITSPNQADGIEFDAFGNRLLYYILKQHPYSASQFYDAGYDIVAAQNVMHLYRVDRAGQNRGIPEITPALPLFAQLRRYTLAVIAAAETAADFAAVLYTDAPANAESANIAPLDVVELEKRMATTLPEGWKLGQIEANQPITTYAEFVRSILNEIARCMNLPLGVAIGNSSQYNYASGRLDYQMYGKTIDVDRSDIELTILDPILMQWLDMAILAGSPLPLSIRSIQSFPHKWFWDGREHVDPAKESNAQETRLRSNTTTLAEEYAKQGKDWRQELDQRAIEVAYCRQKGLTLEETVPNKKTTPMEQEDDND